MPRVAWQGGTHSQFNRADVAHVARGVADRYRKEQPHDRTVRAHDYHTIMRVSASRGRAPTLSRFAAAFRGLRPPQSREPVRARVSILAPAPKHRAAPALQTLAVLDVVDLEPVVVDSRHESS